MKTITQVIIGLGLIAVAGCGEISNPITSEPESVGPERINAQYWYKVNNENGDTGILIIFKHIAPNPYVAIWSSSNYKDDYRYSGSDFKTELNAEFIEENRNSPDPDKWITEIDGQKVTWYYERNKVHDKSKPARAKFVQDQIDRLIEDHKVLDNGSYFKWSGNRGGGIYYAPKN